MSAIPNGLRSGIALVVSYVNALILLPPIESNTNEYMFVQSG